MSAILFVRCPTRSCSPPAGHLERRQAISTARCPRRNDGSRSDISGVDSPIRGSESRRFGPHISGNEPSRKLNRLEHDARPHEDFRRAIAFLRCDCPAKLIGFGRVPDFGKGFLPQVSHRLVNLAETYIPIGIDNRGDSACEAGNHLSLFLDRTDLRPLKHRLHYRAVASLFAWGPQTSYVLVKILVLLEYRASERRILTIAADDREVVVVHRRTAIVEIRRQLSDLIHVDVRRRRYAVNPQSWI